MSKISEILGCDDVVYEITETTTSFDESGDVVYIEDHDKIEYAEKNIKKIIDTGMQALPDMIRVLRDTDNPKMYSAASSFIESLTKINIDYAKGIQKSETIKATQNNNTTNHVYLTSEEALKQIK